MTRSLVLILVFLAAPPARADLRAQAREHFRRGQTAFEAARYDEAIGEYAHAYELAPVPGLLFNLGQAYRMKGDRRLALEAYEKYLAAQPASGPIGEAQRYVTALSAALEAERAQEETPLDPAPPPPIVDIEEEPAAPRPIDVPPPPARPARGLRVAAYVSGGVGVVAAGGALYFWLSARSISSELSAPHPTWTAELDRQAREALPAARRNAVLCGVAGGAALIAGGVLFVVAIRREHAITVAPVLTPGGAGAQVIGRF